MIDPNLALQQILQLGGTSSTQFPPNSRYHGVSTLTFEDKDGHKIIYIRRRLIPGPEKFTTIAEHQVTQGQRLDNIAYQYIGDPEQFWRICDANGAMRPDELTETIGRWIRIGSPQVSQG